MIDACREDRDVLSRWDQLSHAEPRIWVNETEAAIAISEPVPRENPVTA